MPGAEALELGVADLQAAGVALGLVHGGGGGVVLARDEQDLETLPAVGLQGGDVPVHVLVVVVSADDAVELEQDAVLATPARDAEQLADVRALATADFDIGGFVEAVARDGQDVEVGRVRADPALGDLGPVGDDADRFDLEILLAVVDHLAQHARVQERLAAREVDFLHARLRQPQKPGFGVVQGRNVAVGVGVETEAAFVVAAACEVVVDTERDRLVIDAEFVGYVGCRDHLGS